MQHKSQEIKQSHASQHTINAPKKVSKMESPPPSAILTQAKILQRPPQAPKRKQRPSNKNNGCGDGSGHGSIDHDNDDLDMPHLAALPRRKLFVDNEPTTTTTISPNTTLFPASDLNRKRFRPIQPDRESERRQVQQEDRLSPSRREERAG
jgi:hypothetical protein